MKNLILSLSLLASFSIITTSCNDTVSTKNTESAIETTSDAIKAKVDGENAVTFADGKYTINIEKSIINWTGKELSGESHNGTLNVYKGSIDVTDSQVQKGFVGADMQSLNCTDMSGRGKTRLESHLKSDDFFGTEQHPFAMIQLEAIKIKSKVSMGLGKMTIKDITHPIAFPMTLSKVNENIIAEGTLTFDRSMYDVKFRSGAFPDLFPDLGDNLIYDDVELTFHLEAAI